MGHFQAASQPSCLNESRGEAFELKMIFFLIQITLFLQDWFSTLQKFEGMFFSELANDLLEASVVISLSLLLFPLRPMLHMLIS